MPRADRQRHGRLARGTEVVDEFFQALLHFGFGISLPTAEVRRAMEDVKEVDLSCMVFCKQPPTHLEASLRVSREIDWKQDSVESHLRLLLGSDTCCQS
jgi:hypothetical protein